MRDVVDRFCDYVKVNTQSNESCPTSPSSPGQWILAELIKNELTQLGLQDIVLDKNCYLYAKLPANTRKKLPKIGFVAHLDTSPDESGENVNPQIIKDDDGNYIIKSDGTTLLGADDKAGIAEIVTAIEYFTEHSDIKHGDVYIAFTPDEEIGRGTDHFDINNFNVDFAYTVDGGKEGEIEIENFNAAKATIKIKGRPCHPGYATNGKMLNASILVARIADIISKEPIPETTDGRRGFYHITKINGNIGEAEIECILRDFDASLLERKKELLRDIVNNINRIHGEGCASIEIKDQYRNMFEIISQYPGIVNLAKTAMRNVGITPIQTPIRGGTDGVRLSFDYFPCPNLYTGGINFHSKEEYIPIRSLQSATDTIIEIIKEAKIAIS